MSDFSATQADLQAPNLRLTMAAVGQERPLFASNGLFDIQFGILTCSKTKYSH